MLIDKPFGSYALVIGTWLIKGFGYSGNVLNYFERQVVTL